MRVFVAVADLGSFVEASRRLRLSAAAVTRSIALLEEELGVTLLSRTTRSVRLTERGMLYRETCAQILDDVENADRRVRGEDAEPRGPLTIAAPLVFGRLHVLPIIEQLLLKHPRLSIRLALSDRVVHLVNEGVDLAVRIGALSDSAMMAVKVGEVQRVLVASPSYLASHGTPTGPPDLTAHQLIAFESIQSTNDWRFGAEEKLSVRVEPRFSVDSADAAIVAAEAGIGITRALSYQVRAALEAGSLAAVLQDFAPASIPVNLVYPARKLGAPNVGAFLTAARAHFRAHPVSVLK